MTTTQSTLGPQSIFVVKCKGEFFTIFIED